MWHENLVLAVAIYQHALLSRRGRGYRHAMTPEDLHHFRAVRRPAGGGTDYFGSFTEVRGAHYRRSYDGELFRIIAAEVIEAVHRTSGDAQRLPGANLDGRSVNRPGKDALDAVENLLVSIVLVSRRRQFLPGGDENLEHGSAPVGIIAREEEPNPYRTDLDALFRRIDSDRLLLHSAALPRKVI
jgi:hypothetical protein